ncbi:SCP-like extracellular [Thermoanaerobacter kivui]|uniref:SCP-like extracellular n=1 Tax=Thermoanaerobacter kivui TaxID=2325 RepID=A0A097ASD7_THEKI|nr:CAP domain-containing protein [Thermoanaerobacter kivui]AIS52736.1 SCP-like extracellular [Thermoanaerobacter kivui]
MKAKSFITILVAVTAILTASTANASIFYSYEYFAKNIVTFKIPAYNYQIYNYQANNFITLNYPKYYSYDNLKIQKNLTPFKTTNYNTTDVNNAENLKPQQTTNNSLTKEENTLIELINKERTSRNLKALEVDENLCKVAKLKAEDMKENNYFSHNSPIYASPFDMMKKFGIKYYAAGENIALNSDVIKAHYSLMNSDGHRANILNPYYNKIGIGVVKNKEGNGVIVVELFIKE